MTNLSALANQLKVIRKQIPFATAQALTSTVRKIENAQKVALQRNLESPTPFTVKSIKSRGARKSDLRAKVFVMNIAAEYLTPFEEGGIHKLNGSALLNPKNIKLNKYGNLPRNKLSSLKAKDNTFIGDVGGANGVWQRKKVKKGKKGRKRIQRSPNGARKDRKKQAMPKLLIQFGDALPVKPVLGYQNRAMKMAQALLPQEINRAIAEAMRTAR